MALILSTELGNDQDTLSVRFYHTAETEVQGGSRVRELIGVEVGGMDDLSGMEEIRGINEVGGIVGVSG